jgi:GNAT superfamily N-acetyltransferase
MRWRPPVGSAEPGIGPMTAEVTYRDATDADAPGLREISLSTEPPADPPLETAPVDAYLRHLIARGTVAVAETGGEPIGFGAAVDTGRSRHLADLFVRPEHQGHGIGGRLLEMVYGDTWPRTTFGSEDPRAVPSYVRAGMDALWPNLYLSGDPTMLPPVDPGLTTEDAGAEDIAVLEAAWVGAERRPDLAYWAGLPEIRMVVVRRGSRAVGTAIGRRRFNGQGRWIHHAMAAPDADGPAVLLAALHACLAGATVGGGCVPGPSPLVRVLLEARFRVVDRDTFLASEPAIVDPQREIVNTGFL